MAGGLYSNIFGNRQFSVVWLTFMLHCEAAATLMAGSVFFTAQKSITGERIVLFRSDKAVPKTDDSTFDEETVAKPEISAPVHGDDKALAINKWRHSVVNIIPRRTGSNRSRRLLGVHQRNESTESAILHPVLAYHKFRRQERDEEASRDALKDMKAIKITYDMTISSQSAPDGMEDANDVSDIVDHLLSFILFYFCTLFTIGYHKANSTGRHNSTSPPISNVSCRYQRS